MCVQSDDMHLTTPVPMSHQLAAQCGVDSTNVQRMKASFFEDDDDEISMLGRRRSLMPVDGGEAIYMWT